MLLDNPYLSDERVSKEANSLSSNGYKVLIIAQSEQGCLTTEMKEGVEILRIINRSIGSPFSRKYKKHKIDLINYLVGEDYTFLHCHDYQLIEIAVEVKIRKPNIVLIFDMHEFIFGLPLYRASKGFINLLKGYLVWQKFSHHSRAGLKKSNEVIVTSAQFRNKVLKLSSADPIIIHNFPAPAKPVPNDSTSLPNCIREGSFVVVSIGNIYQTNDQLHNLFEAIQEFENVSLLFVGNRKRFYEVKELVEKKPYTNVFFDDFEKPDQRAKLLSYCHLGLSIVREDFPCHNVGVANRFFEYLSCGLPIISNSESSYSLVKELNCCVVLEKQTKSEFARALSLALGSYDSLKLKAKQASKLFLWNSEEEKLLKLYSKYD